METIDQQALRMACDTFLSEYEGTPDLATLDLLIATATVWEPFELDGAQLLQSTIYDQYLANLRELQAALEYPKQLLREAAKELRDCDGGEEAIRKIQTYLGGTAFAPDPNLTAIRQHPVKWLLGYEHRESVADKPDLSDSHASQLISYIEPYEAYAHEFITFCRDHGITGMPVSIYEACTLRQLYEELCKMHGVTLKG